MTDRQYEIIQESSTLLDAYVQAVRSTQASSSAILTSADWILQSAVAAVTASAQLSGDAAKLDKVNEGLQDLECSVRRRVQLARQVLSATPRPQKG